MFATSMHLAANNRARWNDLPSPNKGVWQWLALVEQLTGHLARATDFRFNILCGESIALPLPAADVDREFLLQRPSFAQTRVIQKTQSTTLVTSETREVGSYTLAAGGSPPVSGFSANVPPSESDLSRISEEQLEQILGKGRFQVARSLDEIKADVTTSQMGKEVFPLVLLLAILAFCGEHFVANWFYETDAERSPQNTPARTGEPSGGRSTRPREPARV